MVIWTCDGSVSGDWKAWDYLLSTKSLMSFTDASSDPHTPYGNYTGAVIRGHFI